MYVILLTINSIFRILLAHLHILYEASSISSSSSTLSFLSLIFIIFVYKYN